MNYTSARLEELNPEIDEEDWRGQAPKISFEDELPIRSSQSQELKTSSNKYHDRYYDML